MQIFSQSSQNPNLGMTAKTPVAKTKSTSIKRSTAGKSQTNQTGTQAPVKSQTTMLARAVQKNSKSQKREQSTSASQEKIRVARGHQTTNSRERSPNGLSSQDARSTKAVNKSFQFGH